MGHHDHDSHFGGIVFGILAGVALGMLFSPASGRENRRKLGNWMREMEDELEDRLSRIRNITQEKYNSIVDELSRKYAKLSGIKDSEYDDFIMDLKNRWNRIKEQWRDDDTAYMDDYDDRWR